MRKSFATSSAILTFATLASAQQGMQGPYGRQMDGSIDAVDRAMATYLNGDELKSVLTPGEFVQWTLNLKAGQVLIAEARSDAFDPGLQVLDGKGKVLAQNDDRYPGDQRPLILWRCGQDGPYGLQVRCFHDKSGGQVFARFRTYESVDLGSGEKVERDLDHNAPFLLRIPMNAGQIKEVVADFGGDHNFMSFRTEQVIAPDGLPDINLSQPISSAMSVLVAPVSGDYYTLEYPGGGHGQGRVHVGTREIVPVKFDPISGSATASVPSNTPTVWEMTLKAGQLLETSAPELSPNCRFALTETPDVSKFDMSKDDTNPFFPRPDRHLPGDNPPFDLLPARARDNRIIVFRVKRDAKIWLATNGAGPVNRQFKLSVKPAAAEFSADKSNSGTLRIANTDYWAFDAKAGDVMTFNSAATGFSQTVVMRDPDLNEVRHAVANVDQTADDWQFVFQRPGRYLVAMSCMGDGGGGTYALSRKVYHAKEFGLSSPAKGEIGNGDVQIWRFTVQPKEPLLVHWTSSSWGYERMLYQDDGQITGLAWQQVGDHDTYAIATSSKPQTFLLVLTGSPQKATYSIEMSVLGRKGS